MNKTKIRCVSRPSMGLKLCAKGLVLAKTSGDPFVNSKPFIQQGLFSNINSETYQSCVAFFLLVHPFTTKHIKLAQLMVCWWLVLIFEAARSLVPFKLQIPRLND